MKTIKLEKENKEDDLDFDIYGEQIDALVENDEISSEEEAFIRGYLAEVI